MYLGEVPKTDKITIAFDIKQKHFDFTTDLMPDRDREDPDNVVYASPIVIMGNVLHLDGRCQNIEIRYLNQISGRLHVWKGVTVRYTREPDRCYVITAQGDSIPLNRRHSIRIAVGYRGSCTISLLNGKYPCVVNDISVTGVGINVGADLAAKNLVHRLIYTYFEDDLNHTTFNIKARILHVYQININTVRCGCEIINITPSINEYINIKQTHSLARAANFNDALNEKLNRGLNDIVVEEDEASESKPASQPQVVDDVAEAEGSYWLKDGEVCPVCETGRLHFIKDAYYCDICGSILE